MRRRLTADTLKSAQRRKKADPYTMNQERVNPSVTKYMNWNRTPGHDLPFGGPADTHELHENDKKVRDPATHMILPEGGAVKASREIDNYLRAKATRAIKLAKCFFAGAEVKASVVEKIATKLMNLSDDALTATLDLVAGKGEEQGPAGRNKKPVIIDDWSEGEGLKVGKKQKTAVEPVIEDLTSKEGQDFKAEEDYGQTDSFPVDDGSTKASVDAIDAMLFDLEPTIAKVTEQDVSFHSASMDISDEALRGIFAKEDKDDEEEKKCSAVKTAEKKGIKKVASAPAATNMSSADLGMSLFGSGVPSDSTGGLF